MADVDAAWELLAAALGRRRDSQEVAGVVALLGLAGKQPAVSVPGAGRAGDDASVFTEFKPDGISLGFAASGDGVLALSCVWCYAGGVDGYRACSHPLFRQFDVTAKELVEKLGEPQRKGGGHAVPIWVEYTRFRGLPVSVTVEFVTTQWDDCESPVKTVSFVSSK
ncbi:hypothetical protein DIPPA_30000 [Diplonema papillatum]|nr:hypothetical protein DIPPA_30000 [Diplonema papillatum]|eukprot:gene6188-9474_t